MIAFRPAADEDRVFVISSWIDSFRDCHNAGMISMANFHAVMWPEIELILARPGCRTIIAVDEQLLGFVTADTDTGDDPPLVFYVYVKGPYRRWHIARRLLGAMGIDPKSQFDYAYKTPAISHMASKIPLARHQPMLARFPKGKGYRR